MKSFILALVLNLVLGSAGIARDDAHPAGPSSPISDEGNTPASDFRLYFDSPSEAPQGSLTTFRCLLDNPDAALAGWSLMVCRDSSAGLHNIVSAQSGEVTTTVNGGAPAAFAATAVFQGHVLQGVIVDFFGNHTLPAGLGHEVLQIQTRPLGEPGETVRLQYCSGICDEIDEDSIYESLLVPPGGGTSIFPDFEDGETVISEMTPSTMLFLRGDVDGDLQRGIGDFYSLQEFLFLAGEINCADSADLNDDGRIDVADLYLTLSPFFGIEVVIPGPSVTCGDDETVDELTCLLHFGC